MQLSYMIAILISSVSGEDFFSEFPSFLRSMKEDIVGGTEMDVKQRPYIVQLRFRNRQICGGSIISPEWIVTAAHCTQYRDSDEMSIRAGTSKTNSGGVVVKVAEVFTHPQFEFTTLDYDISLLNLATPLKFNSKIQSIGLPKERQTVKAGTVATVSGFGLLTQGGRQSDSLQSVDVPVISKEECQKAYGADRITNRMLCAGLPEGGKDACQADSGGPLVINDQLIGIVSWGVGCARPKYPGVYANVVALREYITDIASI